MEYRTWQLRGEGDDKCRNVAHSRVLPLATYSLLTAIGWLSIAEKGKWSH
jgi:hypothetical protein